ncbi:MAG: hypothetical protein ACREWE_15720, partial [Gammaproteobacteria bacterium]
MDTLFDTDRVTGTAIWEPPSNTPPGRQACNGYYASREPRPGRRYRRDPGWGVNDQIKGVAGLDRRWWV